MDALIVKTPTRDCGALARALVDSGANVTVYEYDSRLPLQTAPRSVDSSGGISTLVGPNVGYFGAMSRCLDYALLRGEYVALLNDDLQVERLDLNELQYGLNSSRAICASPMIAVGGVDILPTTMVIRGGLVFERAVAMRTQLGETTRCMHGDNYQGAFLVFDTRRLREIGFDERFFLYGEETDLFVRAKQRYGEAVVVCTGSRVHHPPSRRGAPDGYWEIRYLGYYQFLIRHAPVSAALSLAKATARPCSPHTKLRLRAFYEAWRRMRASPTGRY